MSSGRSSFIDGFSWMFFSSRPTTTTTTTVTRTTFDDVRCSRRFHILPLPLGHNTTFKSRSGTIGKQNLESSKNVKRKSLKMNACDKKKPFQCQKCGRGFTLKRNKDRHVNYECGHEPRFQCPYCGLRSKQTSPVYAHIRKKHPEEEVFIFDMKL
nr:PREDICTED: zinc finger protein 225-like isoform X2 [Megachile rotundata]XP_012150781.1 PREDICTED: zinc finger protein 225-like isoform X3 [Megachile rotundata]